jgi:hypothetical protein
MLINTTPEILDLLEQVRQLALSYDDAEEYFPWKNRGFFRGLKGRNFLFANEKPDHLELFFQLPVGRQTEALTQPFVEVNKSMESNGWLTARVRTPEELATVIPWIKTSYELNKPFRTKSDLIEGEVPEVLDFLEQVRQQANSYGTEIEEYFPFGGRAFRSKKGQIFLHANEAGDHLYVNVRLPIGEREYALSLPFVDVPKYIGYKGWVGAKIRTQEELEIVLPWITMSYDLNKPARKSKAKKV